jgi:hypothetical protein
MAKDEKIIGYVLLILGVVLVFFSVYEMMIVYTGAVSAPNLINLSDISWPMQDGSTSTLMDGAQISQLPNLFFWFILMAFVMLAGGKISQVGVSMIKEVKVQVKNSLTGPMEAETQTA